MIFDIFSTRREFEYNSYQRCNLYFAWLGYLFKCLRCKCVDYDLMIHNRKVFFDAKDKLEKDFDLIDVMNQVRKSKNFIKNLL